MCRRISGNGNLHSSSEFPLKKRSHLAIGADGKEQVSFLTKDGERSEELWFGRSSERSSASFPDSPSVESMLWMDKGFKRFKAAGPFLLSICVEFVEAEAISILTRSASLISEDVKMIPSARSKSCKYYVVSVSFFRRVSNIAAATNCLSFSRICFFVGRHCSVKGFELLRFSPCINTTLHRN